MKKTNLRLNNFFILEKGKSFYLSDIDILNDWRDANTKDLQKFLKDNDITKKINELKKLYDINSNVNFILPDFNKYKKSLLKGGTKIISLDSNPSM